MWVFWVTVSFIAPQGEVPLFGHQVRVEFRLQSEKACQAFRRVIAKELLAMTMRATVEECQLEPFPPEEPKVVPGGWQP